jgi:type II secretory pathway component PulF
MPKYKCKTMNKDGAVAIRHIEAGSVSELNGILGRENLTLISAEKQGLNIDMDVLLGRFSKVKPKELKIFTRQMKVMLNGGLPLIQCIESMEQQAKSEKLRSVIADIRKRINQGDSLSGAMSHHPSVFNNLFVNMIRAGEASGAMNQVLEQLETFTDLEIKTKKNVKSAIRYPIIVTIALFAAISYASVSIVPKFADVLTSQNLELPLPTKMILGLSSILLDYGLVSLGIITVLFVVLTLVLRTPAGAYARDQFIINLPIIGDIVRTSIMARFSMMMKTLIGNGVKIIETLAVAKDTVDNLVYQRIIGKGREKIVAGQSIHQALNHKYMPDVAINMIAVGERSGTLLEMLECTSDYFKDELDEKLENLSSAIEPIVTLVVGGFVALFVASIFGPIFKIYGSFN